jgi:hypothetical protein
MPPMASAIFRCVGAYEVRFVAKRLKVEQPLPLARALIHFLQGNDIGVQFPDDVGDALWIEAAVCADALVDVVGCDRDAAGVSVQVDMPWRTLPECCGERTRQRWRLIEHAGPVSVKGFRCK